MQDKNLKWIASGNTGCTFASLLAKCPGAIGWKRVSFVDFHKDGIPEDAFLISILFDSDWTWKMVRSFALDHGFTEEQIGDGCIGLRKVVGGCMAWVQYFGPDAHTATRRAPQPELLMCVRLPAKFYLKVGFKGIYHLAHASIAQIKSKHVDKLWETSYRRTAKILGHKPTIREAAKTTFYEQNQ